MPFAVEGCDLNSKDSDAFFPRESSCRKRQDRHSASAQRHESPHGVLPGLPSPRWPPGCIAGEPAARVFPLSPKGIIDHLDLRRPIYRRTAAYGHFGHKGFAWERVDATDELLAKAGKV